MSKSKAELLDENASLQTENAALRELLAAIAYAAGSAPMAVREDRDAEHALMRERLIQIGGQARAAVDGKYPLRIIARNLTEWAAGPVPYRAYVKPEGSGQ